jgi:hypothetical protein
MSRDMIGGAVLAAGVWAIFAAGMMEFTRITPRGHAWVVTASEKMSNRPNLVRAALPSSPRIALAK